MKRETIPCVVICLLVNALVCQSADTSARRGEDHSLVNYREVKHLCSPTNSKNVIWYEDGVIIAEIHGPGSKPQYLSPGTNKFTLSPDGTLIVNITDDKDGGITYHCRGDTTVEKFYHLSIRVRPDVRVECKIKNKASKYVLECKGNFEVDPPHLADRVTLSVCSKRLEKDACRAVNYTLNCTDGIHLIIPNPSTELQYFVEASFSSPNQVPDEIKLRVITGEEVGKEATTASDVGGFVTSPAVGSSTGAHRSVTPHSTTDLSTTRAGETTPRSRAKSNASVVEMHFAILITPLALVFAI